MRSIQKERGRKVEEISLNLHDLHVTLQTSSTYRDTADVALHPVQTPRRKKLSPAVWTVRLDERS